LLTESDVCEWQGKPSLYSATSDATDRHLCEVRLFIIAGKILALDVNDTLHVWIKYINFAI
jgi:hypothetical protein